MSEHEKSKAKMIRRLLEELGSRAESQEVITRLKRQGILVTPQQVSNEKTKLRQRLKVMALVDELGSVDVIRQILDDLDRGADKE